MAARDRRRLKVAFLTRYDASVGSSRLRAYQYAPALGRLGIESRVLPRSAGGHRLGYWASALQLARWCDVLILQKPNHSPLLLRALSRVAQRILVDVDDAIWATPPRRGAPAGQDTTSPDSVRRLRSALGRATGALAGSRYLAERLAELATDLPTFVLPSPIDLSRYPSIRRHAERPTLVVGWIGSRGNLRDLEVVEKPLRRLQSEMRVKLRIVSNARPQLAGVKTDFVAWSEEVEVEALLDCDIGLMPLVDDERSRGRCGYKALQYMACGLPVVASPVGGSREVFVEGETVLFAASEEAWVQAILALRSPELRRRMGGSGRERVCRGYSLSVSSRRLAEILFEARDGALQRILR